MVSIRKTKKALRKYVISERKRLRLNNKKIYCKKTHGTTIMPDGKHMIVLAYRTRDKELNKVFNYKYFYSK